MTPKQIRYVRGLLAKAGLLDMKDEIVFNFTNGRTQSLKEMTYHETNALISSLTGKLNPDLQKRNKMIAKIFSLAHEMHWELPNGNVDIAHIDSFCLTKTKHKKKLSKFTTDELPELVTVLERVHYSFLKGI
ncbi:MULTISPECIES: hypothetical protein [Olivibacter]|uniref:DUF1018 domain-containing protein n=1 Tax=Olivibacter jilunii TaxID=985016 RepID=A0ABW6AYK5_9SPHI